MATSKMKKANRKETSKEIIRRLRIQNKKLLEQIAKMKIRDKLLSRQGTINIRPSKGNYTKPKSQK